MQKLMVLQMICQKMRLWRDNPPIRENVQRNFGYAGGMGAWKGYMASFLGMLEAS